MTGKMRWQSPPAVQLPDRANTSLAFPAQGVPRFYPFPPPATVFRSCLETSMLHTPIFISTVCSVLFVLVRTVQALLAHLAPFWGRWVHGCPKQHVHKNKYIRKESR